MSAKKYHQLTSVENTQNDINQKHHQLALVEKILDDVVQKIASIDIS